MSQLGSEAAIVPVATSVMEANASRYHGKAPDELDQTEKQRQKRAVAETNAIGPNRKSDWVVNTRLVVKRLEQLLHARRSP
jgi:hypothetical protein